MPNKHQIVIVGGGNAGLSVASKLLIKNKQLDIAVVDPASKHYISPPGRLWEAVFLTLRQRNAMKRT